MDNRTEPLAPGVWRVEVGYATNAYVLADDGVGDSAGLTLVDTGGRSGGPRLVRSIRMLGLDPRAVHRVLLTHWHADHAGSAASFARSSAAPRILAGADDLDAVRGVERRPHLSAPVVGTTRVGRAAARLGALPVPAPVPDAKALADGDRLDVAGGVEVLATPGHTPGHRAFWLPQHRLLLAGDAVWNTWRVWRGPLALCSAIPDAPATLERLAGLEADVVAVGHGPPLDGRRLKSLGR